ALPSVEPSGNLRRGRGSSRARNASAQAAAEVLARIVLRFPHGATLVEQAGQDERDAMAGGQQVAAVDGERGDAAVDDDRTGADQRELLIDLLEVVVHAVLVLDPGVPGPEIGHRFPGVAQREVEAQAVSRYDDVV